MAQKFNPDFSLIKEWDSSNSTLPMEAPFVSRFNLASKQLHYIAAHHEGGVQSPTLKTIQQQFDQFQPDVVIIEGAPYEGIASPQWYLDLCKAQAADNYAVGGESAYATVLADHHHIDFIPGEPSTKTLCAGILDQGYALEDFLGWQISCILKHWHGAHALSDDNLNDVIEQSAAHTLQELGHAHRAYSAEEFKRWYQDNLHAPFSIEHIATADNAPSQSPHANILQKIMNAADRVREPHILKIIAEQLEAHNKVLVVFGAAHSAKHEPVLQHMLGPAQHAKPF